MSVPPFNGVCPVIGRDATSREGAYALAREIEKRWARLGHMVKCRVEVVPGFKNIEATYHVRSDLVGGLPRTMANKLAA